MPDEPARSGPGRASAGIAMAGGVRRGKDRKGPRDARGVIRVPKAPPARNPAVRRRASFRERVVARTRLFTFGAILVVVLLALALSWALAASFGTPPPALLVAHAAAFVVLAVVAWVLAARSSVVVAQLFQEEDRMMVAVADEIGRPLGRVMTAIDEGLTGRADAGEALAGVSRHAGTLKDLVESLVEAARVASGAAPLPTDLVRLDEVAADLETTGAAGVATIEVDARPVTMVGSARFVRLALANLVRNAAEHAYGHAPGVIGVRVDERGVVITDDGPGMDEDQLGELRSRESWVGLRTAHIGMGLSIAAWVAEVHGGCLRLDNRPGGGLEVRFLVPTRPA